MTRCAFSTILLSDTGEGKTTQIGAMALWHFKRTGGFIDPQAQKAVGGQRTVLYSGDFGGWGVVKPLIALGIIRLIDLTQFPNIFELLDTIASCKVPNAAGEWVEAGPEIGHFAYDSGTSLAHLSMLDLSNQAANGGNVGGAPGYKFKSGDFTVAGSTQTHYNVAQNAILKAVAKSQVSTPGLVTWTFRLRRAEGDMGAIVGPQIAGSALTPELPAWFNYCFRLSKVVQFGQPNKVILYNDQHVDSSNPTTKVLANGRVPLGATPPDVIQDPANVPKMIELLEAADAESLAAITKSCPPPTGGNSAMGHSKTPEQAMQDHLKSLLKQQQQEQLMKGGVLTAAGVNADNL